MLSFDIAIIGGEIAGVVFSIQRNGFWGQFAYYTQLSNLALLFASVVHLICTLRRSVPPVVERLRFYATCLTTLTFLVTVCVLIPWYGNPDFFLLKGSGLFQHLLCPLLAVASLRLLGGIRKQDCAIAVIPTVIYGIVMGILNYLRLFDGPYPFLRVHNQPWYMTVIWFAVLAGAAWGIAVLLRKLCKGEKDHGKSITA